MNQLKTLFPAAILTAGLVGLAACTNPESAPEPENEVVAETMPETPDAAAARDAAAEAASTEPQEPTPAPAG